MILDPIVRVICDNCQSEQEIEPSYTYGGIMHTKGAYDCSNEAIKEKLDHMGWAISTQGQYCCQDCMESTEGKGDAP